MSVHHDCDNLTSNELINLDTIIRYINVFSSSMSSHFILLMTMNLMPHVQIYITILMSMNNIIKIKY